MLIPTHKGRTLTPTQRKAYTRGIVRTHWREVTYVLTDLNHRKISRGELRAVEGGVHGNRRESPSLTLDVTLYDPDGRLRLEPDEVTGAAVHRKRMLQVTDSRYIEDPEFTGWADVVVFTGPITEVTRDGSNLAVLAGDKSRLAQGDLWTDLEFKRNTRISDVAVRTLRTIGEKRCAIAPTEGRLAKRLVIPRFTRVWPRLRKLSRARGRDLRFNASGWAQMRRLPNKAVWTVPAAAVLADITIEREDSADKPNVFRVLGGKPDGERERVKSGHWYLPKWHQDSASQLARKVGDKVIPYRRLDTEENDQIKSPKVANARARRRRNDAIKRGQTLGVEVAPIPTLELGDLYRIPTREGVVVIRNDEFYLDLGGGDVSTIGVDRKVKGRPSRGRRSYVGKMNPIRGGASRGTYKTRMRAL